jgi:hypothetical protein
VTDAQTDKQLRDLRFDILRNAIYHTARRTFLDRTNKYCNFAIIVLGASAVGKFGPLVGLTDEILIAAATIIATLQLVFDIGVKARDHEFLQRRFYELIAKMERESHHTDSIDGSEKLITAPPSKIAEWSAELFLLYAEEPPPLRALDAVAYNAACDSVNSDKRVHITFWQNLWRQFYPFNGTSFPYVNKTAVG